MNYKLHEVNNGAYTDNCKLFLQQLWFRREKEYLVNITIYGLKSCDTCNKAMKSLQNAGYDVAYIDVRIDGVGANRLAKFQCAFGKALTNTRSTTWRNLSVEERKRPALQLLLAYPTLMKRPVIDADGVLTLGWDKDVQDRFWA